jgi:hypothetical protein
MRKILWKVVGNYFFDFSSENSQRYKSVLNSAGENSAEICTKERLLRTFWNAKMWSSLTSKGTCCQSYDSNGSALNY